MSTTSDLVQGATDAPEVPTEPRARIFGFPRRGLSVVEARRYGWTMFGVYVAALFTATHWPQLRLPPIPQLIPPDKVAHFCGYSIMTALALLLPIGFLWRSDGTLAERRWLAVGRLWLLVGAWAWIDEITQPWFDRDFEWADWICDMSGSLLAIGLVLYFLRRRGRLAHQDSQASFSQRVA